MGAGLQIFDDGGNVVWDTDMFIGRTLGQAVIGSGSGVISHPDFASGIPWCVPVLESSSPFNTNVSSGAVDMTLWLSAPSYSFSGTNLFWSRSGVYPSLWTFPACTLYYGVR